MDINITHLEALCIKMLERLKTLNNGNDIITIKDTDYYWNIEEDERYNPYEKPVNLNLGQVSYDYEFIQRVLDKDDDPVSSDLAMLANVLLTLSEKTEIAW